MKPATPSDRRPVLPDSGRLAWWLDAVFRGAVSPDEFRAGALAADTAYADAAHDVLLDGEPVPLLMALGTLRRSGPEVSIALPVEGDPLGLRGPIAFNGEALAAGEAVLVGDLGLIPHRAGRGVLWHTYRATPVPLGMIDDLGTADRALRLALSTTATALADLEVARWRPEVADALMELRRPGDPLSPTGTPTRAVALARQAVRALVICDLALGGDPAAPNHGAALTAYEMAARRDPLLALDAAARRALVSACSSTAWPPSDLR